MSHVRRSPSKQNRATIKKGYTKRKILGIVVILVFFISIILGIIFVSLATP
ncbi:MAG: hypothetical protein ACFFB9_01475 [Promethearchaeota archaeon]